jgi:5'(3')-deoxyribonucleotidase
MQIIYIDMDNVLVDFKSALKKIDKKLLKEYEGHLDDIPGIFSLMEPMPGAINAFNELSKFFDVYILSTAPWENPSAWSDKLLWVKKYLPKAYKRLIISHNKHLNYGNFLIDDRMKNGAEKFNGELILFNSNEFPNWASVIKYLKTKIN